MKVIAIDPGYDRVGIAVLEKTKENRDIVIYSECFLTDKTKDINNRILSIGNRINELINLYKPTFLAIESLFFSKNTKTALSVAEARGVIIFNGLLNKLQINEYTPNQIKLAVTGYGAATKKDILFMVSRLVRLDSNKKNDDEIDAIAIGLTFFSNYREYRD